MDLKHLKEKPIWQMTGEEFLYLQQNGIAPQTTPTPIVDTTLKKHVYGIVGIAKLFGCSMPTANRISELENLFEINRDNAKIRQLRQDVEDYERAVREKAALDEQARLRQLEADRLNQQVNSIKNKDVER